MSFRENFERLETSELLAYLRLDLASEAKPILLQVLAARGVSPAAIEAILAGELLRLRQVRALQERRLAGVGARLAAFMLDLTAATLAAGLLATRLEPHFKGEHLPYLAALFCGYLVFRDAIAGRGLGKRLLGLQVVRMPGERRMRLHTSLLRNLPQLLFFLPDALCIAGESRRRLGDRLARTMVLRVAAAGADTPPAACPPGQ
ncbi:RDD family protein [Pseudoduganella violaceinigra]|uniref:RDD family protein n=1 Tax=Pseudoduganella violaceinigra TaxID=246602 RepID=UPI000684D6F0|nr:RDD family protein [Pseudoduganella violaceinigra]